MGEQLEKTDPALNEQIIHPEGMSFDEDDIQKQVDLTTFKLEQASMQFQKEIEAGFVHLDESIDKLGTAKQEEIEAVKNEIVLIEERKKMIADEAKEKIKEGLAQSQEKEKLPPEEQKFLEVIESLSDFVKTYSDQCKGKNYEEIESIITGAQELGSIGNQLDEEHFFAFVKKDPDKAVQRILDIDDHDLNFLLTGSLIDSLSFDIRMSEKKEMGDMLGIYDKYMEHVGDRAFPDNIAVENIKAQRQVAIIDKALNSENFDFPKLILAYNDMLDNDKTENYRSSVRISLEKKISRHLAELVDSNSQQEAIDLYSKIKYGSTIKNKELNSYWQHDDSLLPDAGKSLMRALERKEKGTEMYDMDKVIEKYGMPYYGQEMDELLNIHQQYLKDYPEIYFNTVMKSPLDLSNISKNELGTFLENIKNLQYGDKEPLLNQDVIESMCKLDQEKQEKLVQVVKEITMSPSSEIKRFRSELIAQLANSENPEDDYKKIESIFLRNCLPVVGKVNKVFGVLYQDEKFAKLVGEKSSPVLQGESLRGRKFQIYKDLLDIHLKSNNESLRDYLESFQDGKVLFDKIDNEGMQSLNQDEQKDLDYMLNRLEMLYESSRLNNQGAQADTKDSLESRLNYIMKSLKIKDGQKISQRLEEMYLRPIGLNSIDQALTLMAQSSQEAEQRGYSYAKKFAEEGAMLETGDLLKGINYKYLENILQNGSVAGEFLGDSAGSDATPLDTDVAMIKEQGANLSFNKTISDSVASSYGELMIVLKNRGQFYESKKGAVDLNKKNDLELFYTGVVNEEHYGIRTGFPSTEIDYFVAKKTFTEEQLKNIYIEISRKGVYVPVVDDDGKLIFTPEKYEALKPKEHDFSELNQVSIEACLNNEKFDPRELLDSLKESFAKEYEHDSGTWEGYSIENHTLKVLTQYEKYFSGKNMPVGIKRGFFRLLIALHDVGKAQAIDVGDKEFQHYYNRPVIKKVFEHQGFSSKEIRLGETLIGSDPVGSYLQGGNINESAQYILQKSSESGMTPGELMDLFIVMYKADAGSYTKDAGGQESLDNMFVFDAENREVLFSEEVDNKIEKLRKMLT